MKHLTNMDLSGNEIQNAVAQNLAAAPENPREGQFYFSTADKTLYVYAGGAWRDALAVYKLTSAAISSVLGFVPREIRIGTDTSKGTASGSKIVYIATDAKKIYLDNASGSWLQIGGQDTIAWGSITGKPSTYTPPIASATRLGGIKVGNNLEISADGTLSAVFGGGDGTNVYLIKQQVFTATEGQTNFTITNGKYRTGAGLLSVFLDGVKVRAEAITETGNTSFQLAAGIPAGTQVLAEYVQVMDAVPYLSHGAEHVEGGTDAIPNATTDTGGLMSASDKAKFDGIAAGANKYVHPTSDGNKHVPATGTSNNGKFLQAGNTAGSMSWVALTKALVGLGNVPNVATNDQTPTYTAASTLADLVSGEKLSVAFGKLTKAVSDLIAHLANKSNPHGVTKAQVGLGNVNNTSDANKPVSTAQQAALDKKLDKTLKGAAGGLAELDSGGKVPAAQLPSYVDDVIEGYLSGGKLYKESDHTTEIAGESGKIYTDLHTNKTYRWSGSGFTVISDTIAIGETSSTAYRGDRGKTAYDHSQKTSGNPHGVTKTDVGLGNVPNVSTNNQTPTYTAATTLAALSSGEKLSVAFGKLAKAVSDLISHLADTTKHITASERTSWNSRTKKYAANVGNGSATEITVTHSLGTQDVTVLVRETASPYNQVFCDVQILSTTQIKLLFATAPASGAYRVIVTG